LNDIQTKLTSAEGQNVEFSRVEFDVLSPHPRELTLQRRPQRRAEHWPPSLKQIPPPPFEQKMAWDRSRPLQGKRSISS
jgi:hypothetical protein